MPYSICNISPLSGGGGSGTFVSYTLLANNWTLNTTSNFFEYSLETQYPSSTYNLMVGTCDDMDTIMYNQAHAACMVGDDTTNKLICMGTKPTANIPVMLYVLEK